MVTCTIFLTMTLLSCSVALFSCINSFRNWLLWMWQQALWVKVLEQHVEWLTQQSTLTNPGIATVL